jgi:hypothetical protein
MTRILIGTPAYGGQITTAWFHSMRALQTACNQQGIEIMVITMDRESLISRGRNTIVAEFLGRPEFTHLLFIDADIGFQPKTVFRMLAYNKPVVGAAYPKKGIDWEKVRTKAATVKTGDELRDQAADFAINVFDEDLQNTKGTGRHPINNGFARVSKVATGFMLIQRPVFDALKEKFPERQYKNDIPGYDNKFTKGNFYAFFDAIIHPKSKRYLSEDYGFCYLWTNGCGGEVYCDVSSRMTHYGVYSYTGSFITGKTGAAAEAKAEAKAKA